MLLRLTELSLLFSLDLSCGVGGKADDNISAKFVPESNGTAPSRDTPNSSIINSFITKYFNHQ